MDAAGLTAVALAEKAQGRRLQVDAVLGRFFSLAKKRGAAPGRVT